MTRKLKLFLLFVFALFFHSCQEEKIDVPQITSYSFGESANMADSIPYSVTVDASYPLTNLRVLFYVSGNKISENIIPINKSGTYGGKLFVPYAKDVDDGESEVKIIATNKNFDYSTKSVSMQIVRPKYPFLTLKTAYGNYRMEPDPSNPYKFSVTSLFPSHKLNAIIEAPAFGENGNSFYFGGSDIHANALETDSIPFMTDLNISNGYSVTFDVRTFEASPFLKPSFAGVEFPSFDDNLAKLDINLTQNQAVEIGGFLDIADWWINPTFLKNNNDGSYKFLAMDGKYRITANQNLKYFKIEPLKGSDLADFDPATKTGGIWVNGGIGNLVGSATIERLGVPSLTSNPCNWNPEKNFAMAPLGNGIYHVKLIANKTLFQSNVSGSNAGIGFFQNSRSFDNNIAINIVQTLYGNPGVPESTGGSPRFERNDGIADSKGNIVVSGSNRSLGNGRTYVFTLNTNFNPAQLSISIE